MTADSSLKRYSIRLLAVCLAFHGLAVSAADWRFDDVQRVVAISDPHGDFDAMRATLTGAGVLDDAASWAGRETHLVVTGDLLDRGPESRKIMDLLMQLEPQASEAGGRVHVLIGNHEVMNLAGDLRYVAAAEYAAFAADEAPDERERWFKLDARTVAAEIDEATLRMEFDARYPPGFFAHRRAFRSDGHYGSWLLQKPILVVIDGTAFVHGGLSPEIAELGLEGVNGRMMSELGEYLRAVEVLTDADLLHVGTDLYSHDDAVEAFPVGARRAREVIEAMQTILRLNSADIHALESPLWYRGNVACGPLIEHDRIDPALAAIGATRVVIGHTPTFTHQVLTRLDGKVTEIDTGMLNAYYEGSGHALVIEDEHLSVIGEHEGSLGEPTPHPRRVGYRHASITAAVLEQMLATGEIVERQPQEDGSILLRIRVDGQTLDAVFLRDPRGRNFVPELAAYQLDRLLELDAVPVTVRREVDGDEGVVQFRPVRTSDEAVRVEQRRGGDANCPLVEQWNTMYIFDALIHNPGRPPRHIRYSVDNWQLILDGHGRSFGTDRDRPDYLKSVPLNIGRYWQERLRALDEQTIDEQFADTLDRRRRRALETRRDRLLESAAEAQ